MNSIKIAFSTQSEFAFGRIKMFFSKEELLRNNFNVYEDNISNYDSIEDLLSFWKPEAFVLDTKVYEFDRMESLLLSNDIPVILFEGNHDVLIEQIKNHFNLTDLVEEENKKEINYIKTNEPIEKVVVRDRIIEKEILKKEYTAVENKLIVVSSLWQGAGSTTLAMNLSRAISSRGIDVSYVEYPLIKPYMFDYLSIPIKEVEFKKAYVDFFNNIRNGISHSSKENYWKQDGINWFIEDTRNERIANFSFEQLLKLIYPINSIITIVDVSHHLNDNNVKKLLEHADYHYVCIEPDPVKTDWLCRINVDGLPTKNQRPELDSIDYLNELQKSGSNYEFIAMKSITDKDMLYEWELNLEKKPITRLPIIPYDDYIKNVWDSTFLYDEQEYQDLFEEKLKPIISQILPREFYNLKQSRKKKNILNVLRKEKLKNG